MDKLLYFLARTVVAIFQALPLTWVARIGRAGGAIFYFWMRDIAKSSMKNLQLCFAQEKSAEELRAIAKENFKRIGENFCCATKTASMSFDDMQDRIAIRRCEKNFLPKPGEAPQSFIVAIGHFGNFELYARYGQFMPVFRTATTVSRSAPTIAESFDAILARKIRLPLF